MFLEDFILNFKMRAIDFRIFRFVVPPFSCTFRILLGVLANHVPKEWRERYTKTQNVAREG